MSGSPPPLEYRSPFELRRPGILTAVACISLIYASFSLLISAFGAMTDIYRLQQTLTPAVSPPATAPTTTPGVLLTSYHYDPTLLITSLSACVCNFALAALLLSAGIQIVRDRVIAARLHWIFAVAKIPVAIVSTTASWMINTGMMTEINAAVNAAQGFVIMRSSVGFMHLPSLFAGVFACGYAAALMIVLSSRAVRQYYEGLRYGTDIKGIGGGR